MNTMKRFVLAACLATPFALPLTTLSLAETATPAATSDAKTDKSATDAEKRAKAADCSKQADAKKLHGTARKEFREACKKK